MNEQSELIHRPPASVSQVNGSTPDDDVADVNVSPGELFPQYIVAHADRLRLWPLLSSSQDVGTGESRNNEFMTVFSHEQRNSPGAIRSAIRIHSE
jgi:hypothetical protein